MSVRRKAQLAVIALFLAGGMYVALLFVANAQLARLLPQAIAEAVGGRDADLYAVQVGSVRLSPSLRALTVESLTVAGDSVAARAASEPALVRAASFERIRMSGVRLIPLIRGRGIFVSDIEIDGPSIALDFSRDSVVASSISDVDVERALQQERAKFSPPKAMLARFRIRDGSIDLTRTTVHGRMRSSLHGLDLELTGITIDEIAFANPVRALVHSNVTVVFDSARHVFDDSLYTTSVRRVSANSRTGTAEIGAFQLTPTLRPAPFFDRLVERADRIDLRAGPIRIEGLDFAGYVREDSLHARFIGVDSLDLHVYADINLEWGQRARPCRYHMGFRDIELPLRIDTIRVDGATVRYSELAKGSIRPGEVTLEKLEGMVVNLTNEAGMTPESPAVVNITAKLFGEAPIRASLSYPLLSPTLDFRVTATVGAMDLVTANRFATNVAGLVVKQGSLDSLSMTAEVRSGRAEGHVVMRYRDLDFGFVDKKSGRTMAWHAVAGFAANLVVRSHNPLRPGDTPRDGSIDYRCGEKDMVFFEFLVHLMADGLKRIVLG